MLRKELLIICKHNNTMTHANTQMHSAHTHNWDIHVSIYICVCIYLALTCYQLYSFASKKPRKTCWIFCILKSLLIKNCQKGYQILLIYHIPISICSIISFPFYHTNFSLFTSDVDCHFNSGVVFISSIFALKWHHWYWLDPWHHMWQTYHVHFRKKATW